MEGIRRSRGTLASAELILHVLDGNEPLSDADKNIIEEFAEKKRIIVRNKIDLPRCLELPSGLAAVDVCCIAGEGIERLKDAIKRKCGLERSRRKCSKQ